MSSTPWQPRTIHWFEWPTSVRQERNIVTWQSSDLVGVHRRRGSGGGGIDERRHLGEHIVDACHASLVLVDSVLDQSQVRVEIDAGREIDDDANIAPTHISTD